MATARRSRAVAASTLRRVKGTRLREKSKRNHKSYSNTLSKHIFQLLKRALCYDLVCSKRKPNGRSNIVEVSSLGENDCKSRITTDAEIYPPIPPPLPAPDGVCLSENCIRLGPLFLYLTSSAANYLNNMDKTVTPCNDFYEFACGRYSSQKVVPVHERKLTVLSEMRAELDRHLKSRTFYYLYVF